MVIIEVLLDDVDITTVDIFDLDDLVDVGRRTKKIDHLRNLTHCVAISQPILPIFF